MAENERARIALGVAGGSGGGGGCGAGGGMTKMHYDKLPSTKGQGVAVTLERALIERGVTRAEEAIQRIMLQLANDYGVRVSYVSVDTRQYENFRTTILFDEPSC